MEASELVGVWRLLSIRDRVDSGRSQDHPDLGANVEGRLVYTASGHMSVNFMRRDRESWSSEEFPSMRERAESSRTYGAYAGRYTVDEAKRVVVHHVEVALIPNRAGRDLQRSYAFEGRDRLLLQPPPFERDGRMIQRVLTWERIG